MDAVYPQSRFPVPLENAQRDEVQDISRVSGQSLTAVLKAAITLGLPAARAALCPAPAALTDADREACMAQMTAEEIAADRRLGEASLAAQGRMPA